jgi:hypothetical protein
VNKTYNNGLIIKRVFVSATPENVIYLHKPKYIWELPVPENYVSSNKIHFTEQNDFDTHSILRIIKREVTLRREEGGIILYCVERNKDESDSEEKSLNSQINVFMSTLKGMKSTGLDAVTVYNSDGIKVALRLKRLKTLFVNKLEDQSIRYEEHSEYIQIKKNEMAICEFYGLLQDTGCKVVLTIGKDLISRGISFVSNKTENPLTATTMIYKPGSQLSQVALCQAIGRLNGTAQPSLTRRLYTTDDVYSNYITFCKNQREILVAIRNNGNKVDDSLPCSCVQPVQDNFYYISCDHYLNATPEQVGCVQPVQDNFYHFHV